MPTTTRVQSFILLIYREFSLDQALEILRLAEDAAMKRHGRRGGAAAGVADQRAKRGLT